MPNSHRRKTGAKAPRARKQAHDLEWLRRVASDRRLEYGPKLTAAAIMHLASQNGRLNTSDDELTKAVEALGRELDAGLHPEIAQILGPLRIGTSYLDVELTVPDFDELPFDA